MGIAVILTHELSKVAKDRKMLASIILFPLISVVMIILLSTGGKSKNDADKIHILVNHGAVPLEITQGLHEAGNTGIRVIDMGLAESNKWIRHPRKNEILVSQENGKILFLYREDSAEAKATALSLEDLFRESIYDSIIAATSVSPVSIHDVGKAVNLSTTIASIMLPYFLVLTLFMNITNFTCDTVAGEKERGTFDMFSLTPVPMSKVVMAKMLAGVFCGLVSSIIYLLIMIAGVTAVGKTSAGDSMQIKALLSIKMDAGEGMILAAYVILAVLILSTIGMWCSLHSETVKESRTLLSPFMVASIVLALMSMLRPENVDRLAYAVPVYNLCLVVQDLITGQITNVDFAVAAISQLVFLLVMMGLVSSEIRRLA